MNHLLEQLIKRATTPLVPEIAQTGDKIADKIDTPHLDTSPWMARLKGFGAGATQGASKVLGDFTSPVGLAGLLAGAPELRAGMRGAEAIAPAARMAAEEAPAAINAAKGLVRPVNHVMNDISNPAVQANIESMYQKANPIFKRLEKSGMFGGERTNGIGTDFLPDQTELGAIHPDFAPVGGEDLYNTGAQHAIPAVDPKFSAYTRILASGGKAPAGMK